MLDSPPICFFSPPGPCPGWRHWLVGFRCTDGFRLLQSSLTFLQAPGIDLLLEKADPFQCHLLFSDRCPDLSSEYVLLVLFCCAQVCHKSHCSALCLPTQMWIPCRLMATCGLFSSTYILGSWNTLICLILL